MKIEVGKNGPAVTLVKREMALLTNCRELCNTIQSHAGSHPSRTAAGEAYKSLYELISALTPGEPNDEDLAGN